MSPNRGIAGRASAAVPDVEVFSRLFLKNVDLFGRVYEIGLMAALKSRRASRLRTRCSGWKFWSAADSNSCRRWHGSRAQFRA